MMGSVLKRRGINKRAALLMLCALPASLMVKTLRHIPANSSNCKLRPQNDRSTLAACLE